MSTSIKLTLIASALTLSAGSYSQNLETQNLDEMQCHITATIASNIALMRFAGEPLANVITRLRAVPDNPTIPVEVSRRQKERAVNMAKEIYKSNISQDDAYLKFNEQCKKDLGQQR